MPKFMNFPASRKTMFVRVKPYILFMHADGAQSGIFFLMTYISFSQLQLLRML